MGEVLEHICMHYIIDVLCVGFATHRHVSFLDLDFSIRFISSYRNN